VAMATSSMDCPLYSSLSLGAKVLLSVYEVALLHISNE
jgi:hypothetical protein